MSYRIRVCHAEVNTVASSERNTQPIKEAITSGCILDSNYNRKNLGRPLGTYNEKSAVDTENVLFLRACGHAGAWEGGCGHPSCSRSFQLGASRCVFRRFAMAL